MKKTKEILLYLGFGVATTAVNFLAFWVLEGMLGAELYLLNNVLSWVAAVIFAFVTNKLFVFQSKSWGWKCLCREIPEFVGARLLSLGVEELGLWLFVDLLGFGADTRMNTPGKAEGNWGYRITGAQLSGLNRQRFAHLNTLYDR